jgi:peptidylprolyl isomerase
VIGKGGSGAKVPFEKTPFEHEEGSVGLARPVDDKNAGDSQIYFSLGRSRFLDGEYTLFGKVVSGVEVLRKLSRGDKISSARIVSE